MKHKVKIKRSGRMGLWYVGCLGCRWEPSMPARSKKFGFSTFGRDTWDAAFALGIAHQKNEDIKERLKAA